MPAVDAGRDGGRTGRRAGAVGGGPHKLPRAGPQLAAAAGGSLPAPVHTQVSSRAAQGACRSQLSNALGSPLQSAAFCSPQCGAFRVAECDQSAKAQRILLQVRPALRQYFGWLTQSGSTYEPAQVLSRLIAGSTFGNAFTSGALRTFGC